MYVFNDAVPADFNTSMPTMVLTGMILTFFNKPHVPITPEEVAADACEQVGKLIITLAPTGMIPTKSNTPHVPITPEEVAADACEAYKLGASIIHVHARDERGKPTYRKELFEEIFKKIRRKCPGMIICATTSGRVDPQVEHRAEVLDLCPEMAS